MESSIKHTTNFSPHSNGVIHCLIVSDRFCCWMRMPLICFAIDTVSVNAPCDQLSVTVQEQGKNNLRW